MNNRIHPCLWSDHRAGEMADFYVGIFPRSAVRARNPIVTDFEILGHRLITLNGGPIFAPNPTLSLFALLDTVEEVDGIVAALLDGGKELMALDAYPWSRRYAWVEDRYGVSWQVMLAKDPNAPRLVPALMFTGAVFGQARAAMELYVSVFPNAGIELAQLYPDDDESQAGRMMHGRILLDGQPLILMDSIYAPELAFTEGASLVVSCADQAEVDHYWDHLTDGGEESMCGWLKDRFGFSWQVVPTVIEELMQDPLRAERVTRAFMDMKKLDIDALSRA